MASKVNSCKNCGVLNKNPSFCSKSCAAFYNNKKRPKRILTKECKSCRIKILSSRTYCRPCNEERQNGHGDITIAEAVNLYSKHHRSSAFALIRTRAREAAKKLGYKQCAKCGYDKHVEIAHIKAISSFDVTALISVVNSPENLVPLCPNCHWEYDNL